MQSTETTPSINFNFDSSNLVPSSIIEKTQSQQSFLHFGYSETSQKHIKNPHYSTPLAQNNINFHTPNNNNGPIPQLEIHSDHFFENFHSNFMVNFNEVSNPTNMVTDFNNKNEPFENPKVSLPSINHDKSIMCQTNTNTNKVEKENLPFINKNLGKVEAKETGDSQSRFAQKGGYKIKVKFEKGKKSNGQQNENLMIMSLSESGCWTNLPKSKKDTIQPINNKAKGFKKTESSIFSTGQVFKETLRSTTLDNWKKKHTLQKNEIELKQKSRINVFQSPFAPIR